MTFVNRWLFDTTYILPWFGINVNILDLKKTLKEILNTQTGSIIVTSCSLIEGKWKSIREYRKKNNSEYLERANHALQAFAAGRYFQILNPWLIPEVTFLADELLKHGIKDYMDCWIAGTARKLGLKLVSEDDDLKQISSILGNWNDFKVIDWTQFVSEFEFEKI